MFHIKCGMNESACREFKRWLFQLDKAAKLDLLAEAEAMKLAGLGQETVVRFSHYTYETHVKYIDSTMHYFLFGRNILDNFIIVLGFSHWDLGFDRAKDQAIRETAAYFN